MVVLPSFSLAETLLAHYATRLPALEHRFLVASVLLGRVPTCHMVFLASQHPGQEVIDYYLDLLPPEAQESARRRLEVVVVEGRPGRSLAANLAEAPAVVEDLRRRLGDRPAYVEPWNVTAAEVEVGRLLGAPLFGTDPTLWPLGFKSAGRRLMRGAGVPVPCGVEDVTDLDGIRSAIAAIRSERPGCTGVVVKHDDSGSGDGNLVLRFEDLQASLDAVPDWYLADLRSGGVVEELVSGEDFASPSAQVDITPAGEVLVVATHEQLLSGEEAQVYQGCTFPAAASYSAELARHAEAVGRSLLSEGALGRFSVDFAVARHGDEWEVRALEINLRRGGTTHPYVVLRHLVPGRYDPSSGAWVAEAGFTRVYRATDNLVDPRWQGLSPAAVIDAVRGSGVGWNASSSTGVVMHMLGGLGIDGRIGLTAIARTADEASTMEQTVRAAIDALVRRDESSGG